ncbi:MAG: HU family DNA-binding protein [Tagaea sp.]|nr:HU family DNA-binding protein [Magnetospirillum sp.]
MPRFRRRGIRIRSQPFRFAPIRPLKPGFEAEPERPAAARSRGRSGAKIALHDPPHGERRKRKKPREEAYSMAEKQEVVTLKAIAYELAEKHAMPKKQAVEVLDGFVAALTKSLKKGAKIRVPGLGIFQVRKRPARMGRNPATGEQIKIKASKKVAFRAAKDLKEAV